MFRSFHYTVIGSVQGVFFRVHTHQAAERLGVRGYVKNELNGDVTGVAQGDDGALAKFKEVIGKGPEYASVKEVKYSDERDIEEYEYQSFEVVRKRKK